MAFCQLLHISSAEHNYHLTLSIVDIVSLSTTYNVINAYQVQKCKIKQVRQHPYNYKIRMVETLFIICKPLYRTVYRPVSYHLSIPVLCRMADLKDYPNDITRRRLNGLDVNS